MTSRRSYHPLFAALLAVTAGTTTWAAEFVPVTDHMLREPDPADWLMYSRTYDAQRYSPLTAIDTGNVDQLQRIWMRELGEGITETVPLVYRGVLYLIAPGAKVLALDAASGATLWEYERPLENRGLGVTSRSKNLAIYDDLVFFTSPDSFVVALDARTGAMRWEAKTDERGHTSGPLVVEGGLVISGGTCAKRESCYIVAHDARTGRERWRFYTTPAPGEPGDESWGGAALANRRAGTWGFPGSYDPDRKLVYWGIANPMPDMRIQRHDGNPDAIPTIAPADLYSNSTVALDPATGKLIWYYQHLPGDDADLDHTHERTLVRTRLAPDPKQVRWINPRLRPDEERDVVVTLPEGGGIFVNDRATGEFLWATPFPFATELMSLRDIEVATGRTIINRDLIATTGREPRTICFWNTRSYWPTAYHPGTNSLYTSYIDNCREITGEQGRGAWRVVQRPGGDPAALSGLAKIDLATGAILRFSVGRAPGNGALLTTAGNLVFHGDMSQKFRAFDARDGRKLWETAVSGNVSVSTITYAVDGKQYVAVITGDNMKVPELQRLVPELEPPPKHNAIYVFGL
ncbi:MAG: PQQ-binding-like beta-propeller repeat protein [Gammaproteobacteria bacterium]|nr:PQQ-binding-like beta-propeller repeat protein [Gammaproteobacteria bacterium]